MTAVRLLAAFRHPFADPLAAYLDWGLITLVAVVLAVTWHGTKALFRWFDAFIVGQIEAAEEKRLNRAGRPDVLDALWDLPAADEPETPARPSVPGYHELSRRRALLRRLPRTSRTANSQRSTKP